MNRRNLFFLALAILFPAISRAEDDRQNSLPNPSSSNTGFDLAKKKSPPLKITPSDASETANSNDRTKSTGIVGSAFKTFFSLLVVLALIFAAAWMLKKNKLAFAGSNSAEVLEVLGKRTVAQRQSVYLVRLGSRILVLGSGADGLTSLCEITDPVEVDYLAGLCKSSSQNAEKPLSFLSMFRKENRRETPTVDSALISSVEIRRDSEEIDDDPDDLSPHQFQEQATHA